jgi:hypothetical protein
MIRDRIEPNATFKLKKMVYDNDLKWVSENTAILVCHGIGNQMPLETIDQFARGLIKVLRKEFPDEITLTHDVVTKDDGSGGYWIDNVLRIAKKGSPHFIDIYEYYWAHYTEDKATWTDLNNWLEGVIKGAKSFYDKNAALGQYYKDSSIFFDSRTGKFNVMNYRIFISAISKTFLTINSLAKMFLWLISRIPFLGSIAESLVKSYSQSIFSKFANIVGDVVVYNVIDPKSKFYDIRRKIQDGAVKALSYLIERTRKNENGNTVLYYDSVIVAGHSLGSQVSYDAINRLNLLINQEKIGNYRRDGKCKLRYRSGKKIADQLKGYITFGSPLDKIVFFLRENVDDTEYVRQQLLSHFHGFKIRDLIFMNRGSKSEFINIDGSLTRLLENIPWRNYYDNTDYVSGGLDYFEHVVNIDCQFKAGKFGFTHSDYWTCDAFYKDIVLNYLNKK